MLRIGKSQEKEAKMSSLSKQEQLLQLIDEQQECLRQALSAQRSQALIALTGANDWRYLTSQDRSSIAPLAGPETLPEAVSTHTPYLFFSGWHKALRLCFAAASDAPAAASLSESALAVWADQVLLECDRLAAGEQVLAHCETGCMRMQQGGEKDFSVWLASKKMPTEWREREDLAWWTQVLAGSHEREGQVLAAEREHLQPQLEAWASQWSAQTPVYRTTSELDDYYHRVGQLRVKSMASHLLYPAQTQIGGGTIEEYRAVLAVLIGWALKHLDLCRALVAQRPACALRALLAPPQALVDLSKALADTLGCEQSAMQRVLDAYSLSVENAGAHCSVAGTPAPPLLRLDEQRLVWSLAGLLSEPCLFLTRELKRRHSYEYHAVSPVHEAVFRQDLYQLFADKRFVKSTDRIELRGVQGDLTTDVDALIFDRKTGALALFELKSQDLFAYSRQERIRQRDYFYRAGKQILACVQWLERNEPDALLARLDPKLVKRLKVQKTYIFVLGRYLAHFFDGPAFDRRAAWGTWPQVLRLWQGSGSEVAHPIQSLYNKLLKDTPLLAPSSPILDRWEIPIGAHRISIYPDFQTYRKQVG